MRYNVAITSLANNDLREIHEYLSDFGEITLKKFKESFEKYIDRVSSMPYMFGEYEYIPNFRKAKLAYEYLAVYRVDERRKEVNIYRILHAKINIVDLI